MDRRILEKMYSHTQKKECCRNATFLFLIVVSNILF